MKRLLTSLSFVFSAVAIVSCGTTTVAVDAPPSSIFSSAWNTGLNANEPEFHAQTIDENTIVIRQSIQSTFEAPFLYLLFGAERALLIDTGVEGVDLRKEIDRHIEVWADAHNQKEPELVVMHSHGHRDHKGGDAQLANRPNTLLVGLEADEIEEFFGIEKWPETIGSIDLGGRILEIIPTPGHTDSHVMVFDPVTQILFSGDAVYPGRLYFQCEKARTYEASINRLADYVRSREVQWLLGAHIEMTTESGRTFEQQNKRRRGEHLLELPASIVSDIQATLVDQAGQYTVESEGEFILFPHPSDPTGMSPPNWCLSDAEVQ